jgi:hypothetical protein
MMTTRLEVPVTTLLDGSSCVVISPISAPLFTFATNGSYLPFVTQSTVSSQLPFSGTPYSNTAFNSQFANIITYNIDSVQIDFINTQSPLNVAGRL